MEIKFECPTCGQHIIAATEEAGIIGSCPACGQQITIPSVVSSDSIPPPIAPLPQKPKRRSLVKKVLLTIAIVCGGLFALLFLVGRFFPQEKLTNNLTAALKSVAARPPVEVAPVEINVVTNADERLFLMNLLEQLYSKLPKDISDIQAVQTTLGKLRDEANRHCEDIKQKNLDDRLVVLYSDFLAAVDDYTALLVNYGKIESDTMICNNMKSPSRYRLTLPYTK